MSDGHPALTAPDAGDRAVRGGALRVAGYAAGLALAAAGSILLLRHLGVEGFGRFMVVIALVGIVGGLSDAGLTVIGQRDYLRGSDPRGFLAALLGLRLAITPVAVLLATGFAALAGYSTAQVVGTAVAGSGLLFANAAATITVPLTAQLRMGAVTLVDLIRNAALVGGIVALVAASAGLAAFFYAYVLSGAAALAAAVALVRPGDRVRPRFDRERWSAVARAAAPVALALVINVIYLRALVIIVSLLSDGLQTGLYATSFRVLEIFLGVPQLMAGAAFPILAHAAREDEARLAYVLQRLAEASLLLAGALVLVLAIAAEPIVRLLGGAEYAAAAPVLSLQSVALLGAFLTQVWILGLIAIDRQRDVGVVNAVGLVVVLGLGLALVPSMDAQGAAVAAVVGEAALALAAVALLARARPVLRPQLGRALRIVAAAGAAAACALLPVPAIVQAACAIAVYGVLVVALRAHPEEVVQAFDRRRRPQASSSS